MLEMANMKIGVNGGIDVIPMEYHSSQLAGLIGS